MSKKRKYIFIVGGVISGLGKGITAASVGRLLKDTGYKVTNIKIDAYVNVDAGTMNPVEHGEVFVTDDGMETDQDIGNYERFLGVPLARDNYATTGQIYQSVINKERNLEFCGKCVEVVPHIPLEIIEKIDRAMDRNRAEIAIIEIGGTVGEYQNILFIEAARMLKYQRPDDVLIILVSYVPIPKTLGEMKTKPTQYASRTLNETGIRADLIICRGEREIDRPRKEKIALLCNMCCGDDIFSAQDMPNIYEVPLLLQSQGIVNRIAEKLKLPYSKPDLSEWNSFIREIKKDKPPVKIGIVGKYFETGDYILSDVYISVIEAIRHAAWSCNVDPQLTWIDSSRFEKDRKALFMLSDFDGIVVPGGFGARGVDGIISAIEYIRTNKIPYFGLCYGMQLATVEYARNVAKLPGADTTENNPRTRYPVIHVMPEQEKKLLDRDYGGTMRLGAYPAKLKKGTITQQAYKSPHISERHRHRYEFNNEYRQQLEKAGLVIAGTSPDDRIVEIIELDAKTHPFFVGVQFHPEFQSQPTKPHPLFAEFIKAAKR